MSLYFLDKQVGDQPKSPPFAANVDLIPLETPQQEEEKPVGESTAIARGILGCHSALVVSDFLYSSTFVELSSTLYYLCFVGRVWPDKSLRRPSSFGRLGRISS